MNKHLVVFLTLGLTPLLGCKTLQAQFKLKAVRSQSDAAYLSTITEELPAAEATVARKALILGNANYPPSRLLGKNTLSNPRNDALDIAKRLKDYDFQVTTVIDAKPKTMQKKISEFIKSLTAKDVALFYYSGHGIATACEQELGVKNFIIPVGVAIDDYTELCRYSIATESILDKMTQRGNGINILILDSCRQNLSKLEAKGVETQGFSGMYGGSGTFIGYATAPGKLALGNYEQRNSLYTETLLKVLKPPYDNQPIESLFQKVRTLVVQEANKFNRKQVPWDTNGLETSFCFRTPCHSNDPSASALRLDSTEKTATVVTTRTSSPKQAVSIVKADAVTALKSFESEPETETETEPESTFNVLDTALTNTNVLALHPALVRIPGGCFAMGSSEFEIGHEDNEMQHQVCLDGFYIGQYEVTNAEFRWFRPQHDSGEFEGANLNAAQQPVVNVNWFDAVAYTRWLSQNTGRDFRLPTEAEWEYAARAGSVAAYWWDEIMHPKMANFFDPSNEYEDDGFVVASPIGAFPQNPWNIADMHGNVWEWTCSAYSATYDGLEQECQNFDANVDDATRVVRGGSWSDSPNRLRSAYRDDWNITSRVSELGFRVVEIITE